MTTPIEHQDIRFSNPSKSKTSLANANRAWQLRDRIADRFAPKPRADESASVHKQSTATSIKTDSMMREIETNTLLSSLWLFMLLNVIFRDIHQLAKKSYLEMLLATEISDVLLFVVGFVIEIPIAMVLFSLLLARRILRPITLVAALVTTAGMISVPPTDLDDVFFLIIQLLAMVAILWTAWRWPQEDHLSTIRDSE